MEHLRRYYFACVVYQLRINDTWVTHMRRIWRMNGDATAYDVAYENHCVFTVQVAYAQRTSHERAAVNAILWRMAGVCTAHGLRTCRTYENTS